MVPTDISPESSRSWNRAYLGFSEKYLTRAAWKSLILFLSINDDLVSLLPWNGEEKNLRSEAENYELKKS